MSGERVSLVGSDMLAVVQAVHEVRELTGARPVVIGGLAVLCRVEHPHRATVDLDVVDRLRQGVPHLQLLRAAEGAVPREPAGALLPTPFGPVEVDVLEVRQVELDEPSDEVGDRLHASAHAWAFDTATDVTLRVSQRGDDALEVTTGVAEPGPLVAMKLQAVMNRSSSKEGADLLDVVRLALDRAAGPTSLLQLADAEPGLAADVAQHVDLWLVRRLETSYRAVQKVGGHDIDREDLRLTADRLLEACERH